MAADHAEIGVARDQHAPLLAALGETKQLTATVVDAAGRAIEDQPLDFISDDPTVLTVSATGLLTAVGPLGEARITVASGELTAGVIARTVLPANAIVVQPTELMLQPTQSAQLWVTVTNELSEPVSVTVTYRTTNSTVAVVDGFGVVTARQKGTATIAVSAPDREDAEVPVVVDQVPTTIEVTPTSAVLQRGGVQPLTVLVRDAFGTPVSNPTVTFASDAPEVASVSIGGLVRGEAEGSATITVTSGTLSATVGVFVGTAPPGVILQHVLLDGGAVGRPRTGTATSSREAGAWCTADREPASASRRPSPSPARRWTWMWTAQASGPMWRPRSIRKASRGSRSWTSGAAK